MTAWFFQKVKKVVYGHNSTYNMLNCVKTILVLRYEMQPSHNVLQKTYDKPTVEF